MVAHVVRLGPVATTFVALMISTGASLSWWPFELALSVLEAETQRLVLSVVRHTTLRQLQLGWRLISSFRSFSAAFGLLCQLSGSSAACWTAAEAPHEFVRQVMVSGTAAPHLTPSAC